MTRDKNLILGGGLSRRSFMGGAAALTLPLAMPSLARAQAAPFKLGVLLPFSGGLELFAQQGIQGVKMAARSRSSRPTTRPIRARPSSALRS